MKRQAKVRSNLDEKVDLEQEEKKKMQRHEHISSQSQSHSFGWVQSRKMILILLGLLAVGAFFLITERTTYLLGALPFLIFLLCPLMMFFMMHGGHEGQGNHHGHNQPHDESPGGEEQ